MLLLIVVCLLDWCCRLIVLVCRFLLYVCWLACFMIVCARFTGGCLRFGFLWYDSYCLFVLDDACWLWLDLLFRDGLVLVCICCLGVVFGG